MTFVNDQALTTTSPALAPGTVNDVVAMTAEGLTGVLVKGWVSDFLDVPESQQFHSFVTTLVSNAITVGVGQGLYGVDQPTLRQQMAVFLMKALHGLCYVPPPCTTQVFTDVPCASTFAPWINELVAEGITGGCGTGTYCPADPVKRQQMAVLLLKTLGGISYTPPACVTATFGTFRATAPSRRGSTTSSRAASPAAAATATTVRPSPRPADKWRCSLSRPSACNDAQRPLDTFELPPAFGRRCLLPRVCRWWSAQPAITQKKERSTWDTFASLLSHSFFRPRLSRPIRSP